MNDKKLVKKIAKVNVTTGFRDWWESDLTDIFLNHSEIQIISAIETNGSLYLVYVYETYENEGEI